MHHWRLLIIVSMMVFDQFAHSTSTIDPTPTDTPAPHRHERQTGIDVLINVARIDVYLFDQAAVVSVIHAHSTPTV
jgi:hypothetical protein